jgi:hypothetical protein
MSTIKTTTLSNVAGTSSVPVDTVINGSAKAWARFDGTSGTLYGGFNISSVTDNGTGNFTLNFITAFSDTNYSLVAMAEPSGGTYYQVMGKSSTGAFSRTTSTAQVCTAYVTSTGGASTLYDCTYINVVVFR